MLAEGDAVWFPSFKQAVKKLSENRIAVTMMAKLKASSPLPVLRRMTGTDE